MCHVLLAHRAVRTMGRCYPGCWRMVSGRLVHIGTPDPCRGGPAQVQEPVRPDGKIGDRTSIDGTLVSVGAAEDWASRRGNQARTAQGPGRPPSLVAAVVAHALAGGLAGLKQSRAMVTVPCTLPTDWWARAGRGRVLSCAWVRPRKARRRPGQSVCGYGMPRSPLPAAWVAAAGAACGELMPATLDSPTLLTPAQTRLCLMRIAVGDGKTILVRLQGRHVDDCLPRLQARTPAFTSPPWLCMGRCMPREHDCLSACGPVGLRSAYTARIRLHPAAARAAGCIHGLPARELWTIGACVRLSDTCGRPRHQTDLVSEWCAHHCLMGDAIDLCLGHTCEPERPGPAGCAQLVDGADPPQVFVQNAHIRLNWLAADDQTVVSIAGAVVADSEQSSEIGSES